MSGHKFKVGYQSPDKFEEKTFATMRENEEFADALQYVGALNIQTAWFCETTQTWEPYSAGKLGE